MVVSRVLLWTSGEQSRFLLPSLGGRHLPGSAGHHVLPSTPAASSERGCGFPACPCLLHTHVHTCPHFQVLRSPSRSSAREPGPEHKAQPSATSSVHLTPQAPTPAQIPGNTRLPSVAGVGSCPGPGWEGLVRVQLPKHPQGHTSPGLGTAQAAPKGRPSQAQRGGAGLSPSHDLFLPVPSLSLAEGAPAPSQNPNKPAPSPASSSEAEPRGTASSSVNARAPSFHHPPAS